MILVVALRQRRGRIKIQAPGPNPPAPAEKIPHSRLRSYIELFLAFERERHRSSYSRYMHCCYAPRITISMEPPHTAAPGFQHTPARDVYDNSSIPYSKLRIYQLEVIGWIGMEIWEKDLARDDVS